MFSVMIGAVAVVDRDVDREEDRLVDADVYPGGVADVDLLVEAEDQVLVVDRDVLLEVDAEVGAEISALNVAIPQYI
jgi:hypothetical protein